MELGLLPRVGTTLALLVLVVLVYVIAGTFLDPQPGIR